MCGICGYISFNGQLSGEDTQIIEKMNDKLQHRGPDGKQTLVFDNVALGFTRLSIIGLGNGMQPIYNENRTLVLICNGEIFNYKELKKDLLENGHVFRTDSDVEVIIHLYEERGTSFLNLLNGQFAFALYDIEQQKMFCARDQMGILPFYYTYQQDTFIFGSEIKSIIEHPKARRELDLTGLDQVFTFAGLASPRTMFKSISSLENGHYLEVDKAGHISKQEYWDLIYPEGEVVLNGKSEGQYMEELGALFEESVKLRLNADVPVGMYISGGLDSSMITMKTNQLFPQNRREGFSIDFAESKISETKYQQIVADASNTELNRKTFYYSDIAERMREVIYYSECPIKESYNTASHSLSELARSKGIKVILTGEGADELFAGYISYRFDLMRSKNGHSPQVSPEEALLM
ncbi:MAG: asparagine synthase (glutamine-hydrolyzing), partial [Bacteroidota bacterium]